jgi:hypothetical protein
MKTILAILSFIVSWTVINFTLAFAISLVFNQSYTEIVTSGPFVVFISILGSPILSGYVADEIYECYKALDI